MDRLVGCRACERHRRPARRRQLAGLALVALAGPACTSTITPPTGVTEPATVFLLGEAMHNGIVLPPDQPGGEYVEFGYGDWSWFALGNDAWYHAFATVLWPTQGTLGRRTFGVFTAEQLQRRVSWAELSPVVVDAAAARALRARLQQQFDERSDEAVARADLGWWFVPCDRSYWFADTCADAAAQWFVELGCTVGWAPIRLGLATSQ